MDLMLKGSFSGANDDYYYTLSDYDKFIVRSIHDICIRLCMMDKYDNTNVRGIHNAAYDAGVILRLLDILRDDGKTDRTQKFVYWLFDVKKETSRAFDISNVRRICMDAIHKQRSFVANITGNN